MIAVGMISADEVSSIRTGMILLLMVHVYERAACFAAGGVPDSVKAHSTQTWALVVDTMQCSISTYHAYVRKIFTSMQEYVVQCISIYIYLSCTYEHIQVPKPQTQILNETSISDVQLRNPYPLRPKSKTSDSELSMALSLQQEASADLESKETPTLKPKTQRHWLVPQSVWVPFAKTLSGRKRSSTKKAKPQVLKP